MLACSPSNRQTGQELKNAPSLETSEFPPEASQSIHWGASYSHTELHLCPPLPFPLPLSSRSTLPALYPNHYTGGQKKFISIKRNLFKVSGLFFSRMLALQLYCKDRASAWQSATALHWSWLQSHMHAFLEAVFKNKIMSKRKKSGFIHSERRNPNCKWWI